eukprot:SAG31_NODE_6904_length_1857_cov_1.201365_1_plen_33_part_00
MGAMFSQHLPFDQEEMYALEDTTHLGQGQITR